MPFSAFTQRIISALTLSITGLTQATAEEVNTSADLATCPIPSYEKIASPLTNNPLLASSSKTNKKA